MTARAEAREGVRPLGLVKEAAGPRVRRLLRLARQRPLGACALLLVLGFIGMALTANLIAPYEPTQIFRREVMVPPGPAHWLGTDNNGRDVLSRIIHGSRISLAVGLASIAISTVLGAALGIVSAHFEGTVDLVVQRFIDAKQAFPTIILATAILAAFGPGITNVIIAISFAGIAGATRVVRSAVLKEKQNVYVEAARAIGCGNGRVMWRHLLPNVTAPIIIIGTVGLGQAIILEASLSFLGLAASEPTPSWGLMLSGATRRYILSAPWLAIFPGLAISLAVMGWNLLGDALRDVWDPRLRGARG